MKKILLFVFILVLTFACGEKKNGTTTTNKSDSKELNIYTWTYFIPQEVIDDFEKETGIKVNLSYYDSNDVMLSKLLSGAKGYDIVSPSTDFVQIMNENDLLEELDKTKLKTVFDNLDYDNLKLNELSQIYDPELKFSIPYTFSATGIAVNKKFAKEYPKSFDIFSMAEYEGRMTMLDDGREVLGATLQYLGYKSDSENDEELNKAKQKLLEWKSNLAKFDSTSFGKGVATGEFYVSLGYAENLFSELSEEEYNDYEFFIPKGAMMYIDSMSILKNSPNKENAYKFLEFLYRPENFSRVFGMLKAPSVIKNVEETSEIKALVSREEVVNNAVLPAALNESTKEKQDKIWNDVKISN